MASIELYPVLPWWCLAALSGFGLSFLIYGILIQASGVWLRVVFVAVGIVALFSPIVTKQDRKPLPDVVAIVLDESASQRVSNRLGQGRAVFKELKENLLSEQDLDIRFEVIEESAGRDGTYISDSLTKAFSDVPFERISGAFVITDGQVHDAKDDLLKLDYPVHFLLTGDPELQDRHLVIEEAPTYGIVGEEVKIRVRVDGDMNTTSVIPISVNVNGEVINESNLTIGHPTDISILLEREGLSAIELRIAGGPQEITLQNNQVLLAVEGVRSRLSVMLVSGAPGPGLRSTRNLLKADPAVDLVHFTVLRPPSKQDSTPVDELSLIPFPSDELFSVRLREFDLIIFDRYHRRGILPTAYLKNITDYVIDGGAVLDIAGAAFTTPLSLAASPLGKILPAQPTGKILETAFVPTVSERGHRHPVTAGLQKGAGSPVESEWGRWFRLFEVETSSGEVLLTGVDGRPLLVLDRVGRGRVAQLLSDQSWLWARGYEGGGPQQALMRRLVHWLMKQPDLEENSLSVAVDDKKLTLVKRSLDDVVGAVTLLDPDGDAEEITLSTEGPGLSTAVKDVSKVGFYRLEHGDQMTVAIVGETKVREMTDVRSVQHLVEGVATETDGSVVWTGRDELPRVVRVPKSKLKKLDGELGLLANKQYLIVGTTQIPMLPEFLLLLLFLGSALYAWRVEGR